MARSGKERYDGAIDYITKKIDRELAQDISRKIINTTTAGNAGG